jgi:hypothetical protein
MRNLIKIPTLTPTPARFGLFGTFAVVLIFLALVLHQVLQANALICPNANQPVRRRASYGVLLPVTPVRIQVGDVEYVCFGDVLRPDRMSIDARCPARDKLTGAKITLNSHDRKPHCVVRAWRESTRPSVVLVTISPEVITILPTDDGIPAR